MSQREGKGASRLFTRNFTLLLLGQLFSLIGNGALKFALSMYVLEVTGSAAVFAGILSAATIPTILLSPLGGILADRADKRKVMVALDALTGTAVLGGVLYAAFGLKPVMDISVVWFFITASFESQEGTFPDACIATNFSLNENGDIM